MKICYSISSKIKPKKHLLFAGVIIFSVLFHRLKAQNVVATRTTSEYERYIDSLKNTPYKWHFPIMGQEIREQGFDIPHPNGFSLQYVYGGMGISLDSLRVGIKNDPSSFTNVDSLVNFNKINPTSNVAIARYDVWILPFLGIYWGDMSIQKLQ